MFHLFYDKKDNNREERKRVKDGLEPFSPSITFIVT